MKETFLSLIAKRKLSHAYLFEGNSDVANSFSLWLSQAFFCREGNSCGECSSCRRITHHNHPDVHYVEPEGRYIKIDQIRELLSEAAYKGVEGPKKVYIIKEAEKLNVQSANALLKFIEEPSQDTLIMLLCSNADNILPTILSRVQVFKMQSENSLERVARSKGINSASLPVFATIMTSYEEYEPFIDVADEWVEIVRNTMELECNDALFKIECEWEKIFNEKSYKLISIQLINSYVRALWEAKKGKVNAWNIESTTKSWEHLMIMQEAADELYRGFYSNHHYLLGLEKFLFNIKKKESAY
ncbi:DNA polymerase III subunit delta' [Viridibacillus arvi]|uniref:DNA polymerase III subunit delta' n=1 Tax=Viridibacillus arvi TaxID=263475 RepID=UPI0034CD16E0